MTTDTVLADRPYKAECDAKGEHVAIGCPDIRADRARKWARLKGEGKVVKCRPHGGYCNGWFLEYDPRVPTGHHIPDPATPEGMVAWSEAVQQVTLSQYPDDSWLASIIVIRGRHRISEASAPTLLAAFCAAVDKLEVGT